MNDEIILTYDISAEDFTRAGEASSDVKKMLKQIGVAPEIVRKVAIAMYEGEINMVLADHGPGIADIDQAMQAGYSTAPDNIRSLGFGAGMGLPNMKKYSDEMTINSVVGEGTTVTMVVYIRE